MKKLILFLLGLSIFSVSQAAVRGAEISYKQVIPDSTIYEITFKLYRECIGVAITNIDSRTSISCSGVSGSTSLTPSLISVKDITSISGSAAGCNPANSSFAGPGLELLVFKDTVDFSTSPFSSYYNCSETIISYSECCRTSSINTGPASSQFYTYASIFFNNFEENTSSTFDERPIFDIPTYLPIHYYNKQGNEDGDSISFELIDPLTSDTASASYSSAFKKDQPISVFYPTPLTYPYSNPNSTPPIGYYFNEKTGDMIFTPSVLNEISTYTIRATEWRADTSGTMKKSGITHRELLLHTLSGGINNLPIFTSLNTSVASCIGELNELPFEVEDKILVPPPPTSAPDPDTLGIVVLCDYPITIEIDTQQFITSNKTVLKGKLVWHTDSFVDVPSSFDIFIKVYETNKKNAYNYVQKKIKVTNYVRPDLSMQLNKLGCGRVEIIPTLDTFNNIPSFITYSVLNNLDSIVKTGYISPSVGRDSILLDSGTYTIQCRSSFALACDTIVASQVTISEEETYRLPDENDILVCYASSETLSVDLKWESANWSTGDTTHAITVTSPGIYSVDVMDSCGNTFSHSFLVSFRSVQSNQPDTTVCLGTSVTYNIKLTSEVSWIWPDLSTNLLFSTMDSGIHLLTIYDSVCNYTFIDTFELFNIYKPTVDISPSALELCKDSSIQVFATYNPNYSYAWTNGSDSNSCIITSNSQKHFVVATNICGSDTDSISVTQKLPPSIDLGGDQIICDGDSIMLSYSIVPGYNYSWNTGEMGTSIIGKDEKFYILSATNDCGIANDSVYLYILQIPMVDLGPDTAINEFDIINVRNRTPSRFATYLWSFGSNASNADLRLEGTYWLQETNICGTDRDSITITFKPVGKEEIELLGFKIYPNPANDFIQIENSTGETADLTIRDMLGKKVKSDQIIGKTKKIDLFDLTPGKYFVELEQDLNSVNTVIIIH